MNFELLYIQNCSVKDYLRTLARLEKRCSFFFNEINNQQTIKLAGFASLCFYQGRLPAVCLRKEKRKSV